MVRVGVHVSIAGSIAKSVPRAVEAGCDTFQVFSRNPRGWGYKPLDDTETSLFHKTLKDSGLFPPVDHMPYLPNLASPREEVYTKSIATLSAELGRCGELGIPYLVTHMGHHLGEGMEGGLLRVVGAVNEALASVDNSVMILLENTAGEKNSVGSTCEDLLAVYERIEVRERVGFCFDTCHAFAAGYDLRTPEAISSTLDAFNRTIGLSRVKIIHLNDAKGGLGSGLDRHEHIGLGSIGETGFFHILHNPLIRSLPLICETPVDERRGDSGNIAKVRELSR